MSHTAITTAPSSARRWVACVVLLAGGFLPPADFFIVNVSLSSIHEALHATPAQVQLVISGYGAGYAVFLVTGGRLGDLYGRRKMFLLGMAGFTLTNMLCGLATSAVVLVVARVVQGVTASLLVPQVLGAMRQFVNGFPPLTVYRHSGLNRMSRRNTLTASKCFIARY